MPDEPGIHPPSPYREPWVPRGRTVRTWTLRRGVPIAILVLLAAAAEQSVVRTRSAPECVTCLSSFAETQWSLSPPWRAPAARLAVAREMRTESPAAEWLHDEHEHVLQTAGSRDTRGLVVPRDAGGTAAAFPERLPGAFVVELESEPAFGAFLRDAVTRGAADPADLADAVEVFTDIECGNLTADGPPDPRVLEVTNGLWAEWQGVAPGETDLWGERETN